MPELLLIPLEDSVVFPNMSVTLTVDIGDDERVLLVPVHEGEYAGVGTVAEVSGAMRLPGGGAAVTLDGLHRGVAGAARTGPDGRLRVEVEERPTRSRRASRPPSSSASTARSSRRSSTCATPIPRIREFVRAISDAGALADTPPTPPTSLRHKVEAARGGRRGRAARARRAAAASSGSPSCRFAAASARTWSPARRSSSASTSCAASWSRSARSSARTTVRRRGLPREDRRGRHARRRSASRPSVRPAGSSAWATRAASRR